MNLSSGTARVGILAALLVAALFFAFKLYTDLGTARQETASALEQSQKWKVSSEAAQTAAASTTAERDQLRAQIGEAEAKMKELSEQLAQAQKETQSLTEQVARMRRDVAMNGKITGYWRDLFDYTKELDTKQ